MEKQSLSLTQRRVEVREDLLFTVSTERDETVFVIEDPIHEQFFQIGKDEHGFIQSLARAKTIEKARQLTTNENGPQLSVEESLEVVRWLISNQLASFPEARLRNRVRPRQFWNPISVRIPFGSPDKLLSRLYPALKWFHSAKFSVVWFGAMIAALYLVSLHWDDFTESSVGLLSSTNWIWLGTAWVVLKVVHELSHGIACKRHGGRVRGCGLILILFMPLAYVDVTSSWRFRNRWQRIQTSFAGIYAELFVASCAAIVWSYASAPVLRSLCFDVIVMASMTTCLFNANPLMRFDGYFILSDILGIPNLYQRSQEYVKGMVTRLFVPSSGAQTDYPTRLKLQLTLYGSCAVLWRIVLCGSLLLGASALFHGAGVALALIASLSWIIVPVFKLVSNAIKATRSGQLSLIRVGVFMVLCSATLVGAYFIPSPGRVSAPAVVDYSREHHAVVRSEVDGFVSAIRVESGQRVEAGEVLLEIQNNLVAAELQRVQILARQSEVRARVHQRKDEIAEYQAEVEQQHAYQQQIEERRALVDAMVVRSPIAGRIIAPKLQQMVDKFVKSGDILMEIADPGRKDLIMAIDQNDLAAFQNRRGRPLQARVYGSTGFEIDLNNIEPKASRKAPHEVMSSVAAGPLAVQLEEHQDGSDYKLVSPVFVGHVSLKGPVSRALSCGQRGYVWLVTDDISLARYVWTKSQRAIREFVDKRLGENASSI